MARIYLESFCLPSVSWEETYLHWDVKMKMTCYGSPYPFAMFPPRQLERMEFAPITVFYGGNGSGKTTLLNVIAQRISAVRGALFNRSVFFDDYVRACEATMSRGGGPDSIQMISSDDVFDYVLEIRAANEGIDRRREELLDEYLDRKYSRFQMKTLEDYERLKAGNAAKRLTASRYVRENVMGNLPEKSNGESAFLYFTEHIKEKGIYLLDEPENSLAAGLQLELARYLEDSARFYDCQFILATHSLFLLSMSGAKVLDLDSVPVRERHWTELENVRVYADFFLKHRQDFQ